MGLFSMARPVPRDPSGARDPSTVGGGTNILPLADCLREAPGMARHQRRPLVVLEDMEQPEHGYVAPVGTYPFRYRIVAQVSNQGQVVGQMNGIAPREDKSNSHDLVVQRERTAILAPEFMNRELDALMGLLTELRQTAMALVDQAPPGYDLETLVEAIGAAEDTCGEIVMLATE